MIVKLVQNVKSCMNCPNFRRRPMTDNIGHENFLCLESGKKLGDSMSRYSQIHLRNKVSDLCQFTEDEVNQKPSRGR